LIFLKVFIDGIKTSIESISEGSSIVFIAPPSSAGTKKVIVKNLDGKSAELCDVLQYFQM